MRDARVRRARFAPRQQQDKRHATSAPATQRVPRKNRRRTTSQVATLPKAARAHRKHGPASQPAPRQARAQEASHRQDDQAPNMTVHGASFTFAARTTAAVQRRSSAPAVGSRGAGWSRTVEAAPSLVPRSPGTKRAMPFAYCFGRAFNPRFSSIGSTLGA